MESEFLLMLKAYMGIPIGTFILGLTGESNILSLHSESSKVIWVDYFLLQIECIFVN